MTVQLIKTRSSRLPGLILLAACLVGLLAPMQVQASFLQQEATLTETPTATATEPPTPTLTATSKPEFTRPLIVITTYSASKSPIYPGNEFNLSIQLYNAGGSGATNISVSFASGDFLPRQTGGVIAVPEIFPGNHETIVQPLTASSTLWGVTLASQSLTISYTDRSGTVYQESFNLSISLAVPVIAASTPTATPTPTPTPTPTGTLKPALRPQLVITQYQTDTSPLQPGIQFNLILNVTNLGNADASRVVMIVGGGSTLSGSGTPEAGGTSGAGGDFTNFAPLGASNIQSLGNLPTGSLLQVSQPLIVNVSTNPGAYPLKISFSYLDTNGLPVTDEQIVTLLVYSLPIVDISFYSPVDPFFMGQMGSLPLQITNLGRKSVLLGTMRVSAANAELSNNSILIGALEPGGYYPLDASLIPYQAGLLEITVTVDYTDDFNQPRQIVQTLSVEVQEMLMSPDGGIDGSNGEGIQPNSPSQPETLWQKIWRFILGLLGLDSSRPQSAEQAPLEPGMEEVIPVGPPLKGP